jgi:hypothetical protein
MQPHPKPIELFASLDVKRIGNKAKKTLLSPLLSATFFESNQVEYHYTPQAQVDLSLETLCATYPHRIRKLFRYLDLDRPGLEAVKAAVSRQNWVTACEALVHYYQTHETPQSLRKVGDRYRPVAYMPPQQILQDVFTFQKSKGKVKRCADGRLNWAYCSDKNDREWAWFLNRHYHLLNLLAAYQQTELPTYAYCINHHLLDWITASFFKVDQWWAQWRGREVAMRVLHWASVFYRLNDAEELTPAVRILMLSSLLDHACYLRHLHTWGANWLCREMNGLATIALCWSEFKLAPQWLSIAHDYLLQELDQQVYPDGVHKELTSHYHRIVMIDFQDVAELLELTGKPVPDKLRNRLEQMFNYLAYSMCPKGRGLLNNDSDQDYNHALIREAAIAYHRPDWAYIASWGKLGQPPDQHPSSVFPWAGQIISRNGWHTQAHWSFFDVGPLGINYHIHYDKLHLSVAAHGRHLLVDSGRYRYVRDRNWQYFRDSASHNVILIDGKGQKQDQPSWEKPMTGNYAITPTFDFAWGKFDGAFADLNGTATHTRAMIYLRDRYWVVVDYVESDRPRKIEPLWHFHPACTVAIEGKTIASVDAGTGNLRIVPVADFPWQVNLVSGQTQPLQGWWSREYNHIEPNPTAVYSAEIDKSAIFAWVLVPAQGLVPKIKVRLLSATAGLMHLAIKVPGQPVQEIAVRLAGDAPFQLLNGWVVDGNCAIVSPGEVPAVVGGSILTAAPVFAPLQAEQAIATSPSETEEIAVLCSDD